jgi:hypothetical protein
MALDGMWYNEFGSTMTLQYGPIPGQLAGTYQSGVGTAVVTCNNETGERNTSTTWCRQYFNNAGAETLITNVGLCGSTTQFATWESTLVGQDAMRQPTAANVATKRGLRDPAHPRALDA